MFLSLSLRRLLFSNERQKGGGSRKVRTWGGVKGGKTIIRTYYKTKEYIFNIRGRNG